MEVIDKLEIRVPALTPAGPGLEAVYRDLRRGIAVPGFHPSPYYAQTGDLRPFGIPAIAHMNCKYGAQGNHKLELLDIGQVSFGGILETINRAFRFDPLTAGVMRVDLAADVDGIAVSYFETAAYAEFKRWASDVGKLECTRMGSAEIETLYFGKRPNCIRIYNKTAEYRQQYRELLRKHDPQDCFPSFEQLFGISEQGVLTRVERQMGAGRIPAPLATVGLLRRNVAEFNPFARLRFSPGADRAPRVEEVGVARWLQGMGLRTLTEKRGLQRVRRFLNRHSSGNGARILAQLAPFLPSTGALSEERLYEMYRASVERQLSGQGTC